MLINIYNSCLSPYFKYQLLFTMLTLDISCVMSCLISYTVSCLVLFVIIELKAIALVTSKHYCSKNFPTSIWIKRRSATALPRVLLS